MTEQDWAKLLREQKPETFRTVKWLAAVCDMWLSSIDACNAGDHVTAGFFAACVKDAISSLDHNQARDVLQVCIQTITGALTEELEKTKQ